MNSFLEKIHVDEVYNPFIDVNEAATDPLLCTLDSGTTRIMAVVKMFNNRQGNLSLINEYIASELCKIFDISLPQSGICFLDDQTKISEYYQQHPIISKKNYGPAFYSTYVEKTISFVPKMMNYVDKKQIANMIVFDHLVYNKDRHYGNVLISAGKEIHFYLIDHSHIFKNDCIWDYWTFQQGMEDDDYKDEEIFDRNNTLYRQSIMYANLQKTDIEDAIKTIQDKLTTQNLHSIIQEIPIEWSKGHERDINALETYVLYRAKHLPEIEELIIRKGGL